MQLLIKSIADPEVLIGLPSEELALRMLPLLAELQRQKAMIHGPNLCQEFQNVINSKSDFVDKGSYRLEHLERVQEAFIEAWAWLESQGLIVPVANGNAAHGWRRLSRRATKLVTEGSLEEFHDATLLPKALLHSSIRDVVWMAFVRGDYDVAVFLSMKQVEIALRDAIGASNDLLGVKLARNAFHPESGQLTDLSQESGERHARMELFSGALGSYKNPQSHRHVNLEDPVEAIEQVLLASHLLRIIDSRRGQRI